MARRKNSLHLILSPLEDRTTPALTALSGGPYAVGVPDGSTGNVVIHNADGSVAFPIDAPYGASFSGGVRVALADVTGDGTADIITAPGPGVESKINVYDGASQKLIASFDAFESTFTGGVFVAAGDLSGDGKAEIVVGADLGGGPRVEVFNGASIGDGATPTVLDNFFAIDDPSFRGGVRISIGDVNADGVPDLVVGAGFGGGPRVAVFDGASLDTNQPTKLFNDFFAFESTLRNGVYPTVGDLNGDGHGDLIFGAGPGGAPRVFALDGQQMETGRVAPLASFFAGSIDSRQGVEVGVLTPKIGGSTALSIVGIDLATHTANVFGPDGDLLGTLSGVNIGSSGVVVGLPPPEVHDLPIPLGTTPTTIDPTTLPGTYLWTGTGGLFTGSSSGAPTESSAGATVTVQLTDAIADANFPSAVKVRGTATIAIDGLNSVSESFTGYVVGFMNATGNVTEELKISSIDSDAALADPSPASLLRSGSPSFALAGTLTRGAVDVHFLTAFDPTSPGSTFTFPAPPAPPNPPPPADPSVVEGAYTWSGAGSLLQVVGLDPSLATPTDAHVSITLDIVDASAITPPVQPDNSTNAAARPLGLSISGSIKYAIDGVSSVTADFTGFYEPSPIPSGSTATSIGHIRIASVQPVVDPLPGVTRPPLPASGFTLGGTLTDQNLFVDNFGAFDHSASGNYAFVYPALPALPTLPAPIDPSTLVGTYSWTGSGMLLNLPPSNSSPGGVSTNATVTVKITDAMAANGGGIEVKGTMTLAVDGQSSVDVSCAGLFVPTADPSASPVAGVHGRLEIHSILTLPPIPMPLSALSLPTLPPLPQSGFVLEGTLSQETMNVESMAAFVNSSTAQFSFVVAPQVLPQT